MTGAPKCICYSFPLVSGLLEADVALGSLRVLCEQLLQQFDSYRAVLEDFGLRSVIGDAVAVEVLFADVDAEKSRWFFVAI